MNICPVCGSPIRGRRDKKYCSTQCKSVAQYDKRQETEQFYFKVDRQLKVNRKILKRYNQSGYTTLRRDVLFKEGFDPNFFTHYWKTHEGQVYLFVYDFGFLGIVQDGKEKYLIVEWQDYMGPKSKEG